MTTPPQYTAYDTANHLLRETPSVLSLSVVPTSEGPRLAHTVRTPSTTVTVLLDKVEATEWAASMTRTAASMPDPVAEPAETAHVLAALEPGDG